jgi:hypothetical protein
MMPTLQEDLIEREVDELWPLFEGDAATGNGSLAAMWDACLREWNINRIVAIAILWCDRQTIARLASRFVSTTIATRAGPNVVTALATVERWANGDATLTDVSHAKHTLRSRSALNDDVAQIAVRVTSAAGDDALGFDDNAIHAAADAIESTLKLAGASSREVLRGLFRELIPTPTLERFRAAHLARWTG